MQKILIFITVLIVGSCTNYLDLKPYGKVIPKTAEEYSAMIHTMLNSIEYGKEILIMDNENEIINIEAATDNLDANVYLGPDNLKFYVGDYSINKENNYVNLYARIRDCNIVIDGLSIDKSELAVKVIATSKAIRGVCYYQLLRQFCQPVVNGVYPEDGVPLVDQFDMEAKPIRSSYSKTIDFIEKDLKDALHANMEDPLFLFTHDVVAGYLARLYFWIGRYDDAIYYAEYILAKHPLIEGIAYSDMIGSSAKTGNMLIKSNVMREASGGTPSDPADILKYRPVNKRYIDLFDVKNEDIRYSKFFDVRRMIKKRAIGCMRSAEMALILAESYYHTSQIDKSLDMINHFRSKRINNYIDLTMATLPSLSLSPIKTDARGKQLTPLISLILAERCKELFMEGDRFYELKRNGCPETWVSRSGLAYTTLEYMYTFPLPVKDIELVNGLKQNPGYEEFINN